MSQEQTLLTEYTEVCKSYHAISEFRGKLLALIPIVSGTGISRLISRNSSTDSSHLPAIGVFGLLVTLTCSSMSYEASKDVNTWLNWW